MSQLVLLVLLIGVAPFLAVSPGAIAAWVQFAPAQTRPGWRHPAVVRRRPVRAAAGWVVA